MHDARRGDRRRSLWYGLAAGLAAATADGLLIAATDPATDAWGLAQAMLFWTTAGVAVVASDSELGDVAHGVAGAVGLCLPWYVNLALAPGRPELLAPLVAMGVVFGVGFGVVRQRLRGARG
jgi:hypothetical protein